jgi:hypothetical protein
MGERGGRKWEEVRGVGRWGAEGGERDEEVSD